MLGNVAVVAGDHLDTDAAPGKRLQGFGYTGFWWVEKKQETGKRETRLVGPTIGRLLIKVTNGQGQDAVPLRAPCPESAVYFLA